MTWPWTSDKSLSKPLMTSMNNHSKLTHFYFIEELHSNLSFVILSLFYPGKDQLIYHHPQFEKQQAPKSINLSQCCPQIHSWIHWTQEGKYPHFMFLEKELNHLQLIWRNFWHNDLGAVSIRKTVLPGMAIPMLKIRRPNGRLIFNMEITIRK